MSFVELIGVIFLLSAVHAQVLGPEYLRNSGVCRQWMCMAKKLNLPDDRLPTRELTNQVFKEILPQGAWQDALPKALDICFNPLVTFDMNFNCPGQPILGCVMRQLVKNCPDESLRKNDACGPLVSHVGPAYMFSQTLFTNLEINLPKDKRPSWVLNHRSSKCCDFPEIVNSTVMTECGLLGLVYRETFPRGTSGLGPVTQIPATTPMFPKTVNPQTEVSTTYSPLTCCDLSKFLPNGLEEECNFKMIWSDEVQRFQIINPTETPMISPDHAKIVPLSCNDISPPIKCVLRKMHALSKDGSADFYKLQERIRRATSDAATSALTNFYLSMLLYAPLYPDTCNHSQRILMNVIDAMITTCPISKRKDSLACNQMFTETIATTPFHPKDRGEVVDLRIFSNSFHEVKSVPHIQPRVIQEKPANEMKNPMYNFGLLDSKNKPPVTVIDKTEEEKPLLLLPIYLMEQGGFTKNGHPNEGKEETA